MKAEAKKNGKNIYFLEYHVDYWNKLGWKVPSQSGNGTYVVNIDDGEPFCTCQHFENTHKKCQHIYAVEFIEQKEKRPDGTEVVTKAMRVTYGQNWQRFLSYSEKSLT